MNILSVCGTAFSKCDGVFCQSRCLCLPLGEYRGADSIIEYLGRFGDRIIENLFIRGHIVNYKFSGIYLSTRNCTLHRAVQVQTAEFVPVTVLNDDIALYIQIALEADRIALYI